MDTLKRPEPADLWLTPPPEIKLSGNDVHVWFARLNSGRESFREASAVLSKDEHQRADRFVFKQDKSRFIVRRSLLRTIIGAYYLGVDPSRVTFRYGTHGKVSLLNNSHKHELEFNLSDSQNLVLYVFTGGFDVGIDVEYSRYIPDAQGIVDNSCSEYEKSAFHGIVESQKQDAFYNCWTRKEAFIKAIGEGLYYPLDQFDVSMSPGEPARILSIGGDRVEASKWTLKHFSPLPEYTAAVALKRRSVNFMFWRFPETV